MTLGEQIRAERKRQRMSMDGLCEAIGISPTTLADFELNKRGPRLDTLLLITDALGLELHLTGGRINETKTKKASC